MSPDPDRAPRLVRTEPWDPPTPVLAGRWRAILFLRCPACLTGRVFRRLLVMHECCPSCGRRFQREPGFFSGAMYFSYGLQVPLVLALVLLARHFLAGRPIHEVFLAALAASWLFLPAVFRYSRVIWLHVDHAAAGEPVAPRPDRDRP